jgi:hypothetical protein
MSHFDRDKKYSKSYESTPSGNKFIYSHKSMDKWKQFKNRLLEEFLKNKIAHMLSESKIQKIKEQPPFAEVLLPEPSETPEATIIRERRQRMIEEAWKDKMRAWEKRKEVKLQEEAQHALGLLFEHVDLEIKKDLQDLLDKPENEDLTNDQRWTLAFSHLETKWGPLTHVDVQAIKDEARATQRKQNEVRMGRVLQQIHGSCLNPRTDAAKGRIRQSYPWTTATSPRAQYSQ